MGSQERFCSSHYLTARGSSEVQALEVGGLPDAVQFTCRIWHMAVATPVVHTTLLAAALAMQILIAEFTTKQNDIMIDVAAHQFLYRQGPACVVFSCGVQQCVARIATSSVPSSFISVTRAQVRLWRHARVSHSQTCFPHRRCSKCAYTASPTAGTFLSAASPIATCGVNLSSRCHCTHLPAAAKHVTILYPNCSHCGAPPGPTRAPPNWLVLPTTSPI